MVASLVVVGVGKMGESLVSGLLSSGWEPSQIALVEANESKRAELSAPGGLIERFRGLSLSSQIVPGETAMIAVKPADVEAVTQQLAELGFRRLLSIAAGVTISSLERWSSHQTAVIRAMPNTPALVGEGAAAIAAGRAASEQDMAWAESVLGSVGKVVRVSEKLMDAVTALSGSGPAYIFLVAEALTEAGVLVGLPRDIARDLTVQTILGAGRMLAESGKTAEELRAAVTSPGGTTAAGLRALESAAVRAAMADAVLAARDRSAALGD